MGQQVLKQNTYLRDGFTQAAERIAELEEDRFLGGEVEYMEMYSGNGTGAPWREDEALFDKNFDIINSAFCQGNPLSTDHICNSGEASLTSLAGPVVGEPYFGDEQMCSSGSVIYHSMEHSRSA